VAQIFAAATTVVFGLAGATHDPKAPGGVLIAALVFYGLTLLGSIAGLWPVDVRNGLLIAALSRGRAFPPQPEPHSLVKKRSSAGASLSFPPVRPSGHQGDHMPPQRSAG
jgi:hypothetical protein